MDNNEEKCIWKCARLFLIKGLCDYRRIEVTLLAAQCFRVGPATKILEEAVFLLEQLRTRIDMCSSYLWHKVKGDTWIVWVAANRQIGSGNGKLPSVLEDDLYTLYGNPRRNEDTNMVAAAWSSRILNNKAIIFPYELLFGRFY